MTYHIRSATLAFAIGGPSTWKRGTNRSHVGVIILTLVFIIGFWMMNPQQVRAEPITATAASAGHALITLVNTSSTSSVTVNMAITAVYSIDTSGFAWGSLTHTVTGLPTPYTFSADSGAGMSTPGTFTVTILPGAAITFDLGVSHNAMASVPPPGISAATASSEATFSIANTSTDGTGLAVSFVPISQYFLSVTGSDPDYTGLAYVEFYNINTAAAKNVSTSFGTVSSPPLVGPTIQLASLSSGQSFDLVAGFVASSQVRPVPEPTTMLLLGTGLAGVATAVRRKQKTHKSKDG